VDTQAQANAQMTRLAELIDESSIAMMTTAEPGGSLRSRPLATLQIDSDGRLWFFTSVSSPKVDEIARNRQVNLSYVDPERQDYVSISGTAEIVRDRAKMQELWTPWIEPWFPRGLDDPDLVLLRVTIESAEYWDAPESKVQRLYGLAKAMATGDREALGENVKITRGTRPDD